MRGDNENQLRTARAGRLHEDGLRPPVQGRHRLRDQDRLARLVLGPRWARREGAEARRGTVPNSRRSPMSPRETTRG
jgi:hypothetical protein